MKEAKWIQTVPDKGWFCLLRLYSPTEAWYDKSWRPGEIELVQEELGKPGEHIRYILEFSKNNP